MIRAPASVKPDRWSVQVSRTILVSVLTASLAALTAAASDESAMPEIFPYPIHVENLDNGLKVVLVPMPSEGLVAYWTIVRTGSRDEYEHGHTGFAHFFEHMMFRGTERFPPDVYNGIVTRMGADANAFTTDDLTAYHLSVVSEDLEQVMEIESDRFKRLSYAEEVFRTEAGAVYGEYRKSRVNPFFQIWEAIHEKAFERHTYGHTTMGYERDIERMPTMFDYSRSFFSRYYRPENCVLLIAGDLEIGPTMALARAHYGDWEPGYVAPKVPTEPEQTAERHVDVAYEGKTLPIVWLAYKAPRFDPADRGWVSLWLLGELAFGETSAVHKKLVLDEQVVEFIANMDRVNRDPGLFHVYARVKDPARVDYVLGELEKVTDGYRRQPPDPGRLADLKSRIRYDFLMNLDTPDNVAGALHRIVAVTGGVRAVDTLYSTLGSITPEDVQAAAQAYLDRKRRTVGVLREGS